MAAKASSTAAAKPAFTKTPLRISTLTMTADWGSPINLDSLFEQLPTRFIPIWYPGEGVLKFEHKSQVYGASHKDLFTNRKVTTKSFFNQSTLVIRRPFGDGWKEMNMKVFANGGIQMTGLPNQEFAIEALNWMLGEIRALPRNPFAKEPAIQKICTYLINTDYSINHDIQQDALQRILVDEYNLFSMFEKTIYQGVNAKFFYNTAETHAATPGICSCTVPCTGKGSGHGDGECKRITLSIFRTGSIIITGGRSMEQIEAAYEFLNGVFEKHGAEVLLARTT
jgi:TATA-box binding protein (TBP) (component of TFIID and TFIIIB)